MWSASLAQHHVQVYTGNHVLSNVLVREIGPPALAMLDMTYTAEQSQLILRR